MPSPSMSSAATEKGGSAATKTEGKSNLVLAAVIGGVVVALMMVGVVWVAQRRSTVQTQPVPPVQVTAPVAVPGPAAPVAEASRPAAQPGAPRAVWTFDRIQGGVIPDSGGGGNDAVLVGKGAVWTKKAKVGDGALQLDGSSYAEVNGPVINTARSFTVSAWVNLSEINDRCQTVVSVDGNEVSGFYLQFNHYAGDRFAFDRLGGDSTTNGPVWASAGFKPSTNIWYHLAGVYDADAKTMTLYVNGMLQQSLNYANAWRASGKLAIGRGLFGKGNNVDFLHGMIDEVRVYDVALKESQIRLLAFQ